MSTIGAVENNMFKHMLICYSSFETASINQFSIIYIILLPTDGSTGLVNNKKSFHFISNI